MRKYQQGHVNSAPSLYTAFWAIFISNAVAYSKILLDYELTSIFSETDGTKAPAPTPR